MTPRERVLVAFATGTADLWPTLFEKLREIRPGLPIFVVSENPPGEGQWIQFYPLRTLQQNLARIRDLLREKDVEFAAVLLQPRSRQWRLRWLALRFEPRHMLAFNENLDHFRVYPGALPQIARHCWWRTRNFYHSEVNPGGWLYTLVWRLFHPRSFHRPLLYWLARVAGRVAARAKKPVSTPALAEPGLPPGITVVIPSRNGKHLLATLLPGVLKDLAGTPHEIRIIDNGSGDDTWGWLRQNYPKLLIETEASALSFAAAVNRGCRAARFSHTCLLNNDMIIEPGFFQALIEAFQQVPNLFCATAQILFPPGVRREETGKAVWTYDRGVPDFPIRCDLPLEGENHSPVLYGSGGCSLYDSQKLAAAGYFGEVFRPAYVEDLDLGYRGWVRGWPTVFVAGALVTHFHRSTTARYFKPDEIQLAVEVNYLRFLARSISAGAQFRKLWVQALDRLNWLAAQHEPPVWALEALKLSLQAPNWVENCPRPAFPEPEILGAGSGATAVFRGRSATGRPVILVATPYLPYPLSHGGAVRMFNLMREASRTFGLVLIAFVEDWAPPPAELLEICEEVVLVHRRSTHLRPMTERPEVVEEFDSPAFHAALRLAVQKWNVRLVQLEFTQMALYADTVVPLPTLLVEHDITIDLQAQLLNQRESWDLRQQYERWVRFEKAAWKNVTRVVTMSDKDSGMITAGNAVTLPNGVDVERFQPWPDPPEPGRLLFIGSFAHLPNLLAIDFFLKSVWPHLAGEHMSLHIIAGHRPQHFLHLHAEHVQLNLDIPGIELEGFVSDVRPAYGRAMAVIVPLPASAGTNIKIFEAMAMGKAIVSTPAGINGVTSFQNGQDLLVVETAEQMADAIRRVARNSVFRESLERNARIIAELDWSWRRIGERQEALYRELIGG